MKELIPVAEGVVPVTQRVLEIVEETLKGCGFDPMGGKETHNLTEAVLRFVEGYAGLTPETNPLRPRCAPELKGKFNFGSKFDPNYGADEKGVGDVPLS